VGRDLATVREESAAAAEAEIRRAQERVAAVDATFALMRANLAVHGERTETLGGGVERLAEQVAAGRAESEARAAVMLDELAAVREPVEHAGSEVAELRAMVQSLREENAAVRTQAELAGAVAEKALAAAERAKLEDEKAQALQTGQTADGTGDHMTQVFREILGLAAKERPRPLHTPVEAAAPEPRALRPGFDDESAPMAVIGTNGRFKEMNPSFCRLVGYQEHEFAKAAWPSPHDRRHYAEQQEQFSALISGGLERVPVQSTFMHGQGLMVPVIGEITAVKGEDGLPSHLLLRAEEPERDL